jgi:hypothetical protein
MKTYNSKQILKKEDLYDLQDSFASSGIAFKYQLTEGEYNWALFIKNKYCISDFVLKNTDENKVLTFNCPFELSEALNNDGIEYKAVMLSDETALQKLFFWLS